MTALRTAFGQIVRVFSYLLLVPLLLVLPIPWHEIAGHGLVGVLCGGHVSRLQLYGVQVLPNLKWTGITEGLGFCDHAGLHSRWCMNLTDLAGSLSTFVVAAAAAFLLWRYRPRGMRFSILLLLTLWALDLFTFTLPSFGTRRYIWTGTRYSEPYTAAVALGIPGPLFQFVVVTAFTGVVLLVVLAVARRRSEPDLPEHTRSVGAGS